jgi:mannose-6-phosphate isomerase-like protein (cupin superfamily)
MEATAGTGAAIPFSLRGTALLSEGNTQTLLAKAPCLWAHVKVYAEGGENGVHAHPLEDHMFLVLDGEATFVDAEGNETVVGAYEGMMVPRGSAYAFRSSGSGCLVMVRVGAPIDSQLADEGSSSLLGIPASIQRRVAVDGADAPGLARSNKTGAVPGVPIPGRFFPS